MLSEKMLAKLEQYIEESLQKNIAILKSDFVYESLTLQNLNDYVDRHQELTFQEMLFQLIDQKGMTDVSVYKKAWIDRRHFSKIRSNSDYRIGKKTVISLAFALELSLEEAEELLNVAGFSLSSSDISDLVIRFCFENNIYDLHDVNEALDSLQEKPLTNHK